MPAYGSEDLRRRVAELEGGGAPEQLWPRPDFLGGFGGGPLLRWSACGRLAPAAEMARLRRCLGALHAAGTSFAFVSMRHEGRLSILIRHGDPAAARRLLEGAMPPSRVDDVPACEATAPLGACSAVALLSGVPGGGGEALLDVLLDGMGDRPWAVCTLAVPIPRADEAARVAQTIEEIRTVQDVFAQRATIDERSRLARHLTELLESLLARRLEGERTGAWWSGTYVMAETEADLALACSLAVAALRSDPRSPRPVTICPCAGGGAVPFEASICPDDLTTGELAVLLQAPRRETIGFARLRHADFDVEPQGLQPGPARSGPARPAIALGRIMDRGRTSSQWLEVPLDDLVRHGLIVGMTGSGKTNTVLHLLEQLWGEHGIPFLVIEPVKSAYRSLLRLPRFADLLVFTPGDEGTGPFRWNPLEVPQGASVQAHVDHLMAVFGASFVLYPPMPHVLERSLHEIYADRGWRLASGRNMRGEDRRRAFPTLANLQVKVGEVVDRLGYDRRLAMDVQAGLRARIQSLRLGAKGAMLDVPVSLPMEELMRRPVVVELRSVATDEEKAFLIGLLLIRVQEQLEARARRGELAGPVKLRHVTVLEEAHRLLRAAGGARGGEVADPRAQACESFTNLLAEIRAYGEGLLVVDQIPSKLAPDVARNTSLKIAHRVVSGEDRRLLAESMLFDERQSALIACLPPGRAAVAGDGTDGPLLVQVPDLQELHHGFHLDLGDATVAAACRDRLPADIRSLLLPLPECAGCPHAGAHVRHAEEILDEWPEFASVTGRLLLALAASPDGRAAGCAGPRAGFLAPALTDAARIVAARAPSLTEAEAVRWGRCALHRRLLRWAERRGARDLAPFSVQAELEAALGAVFRTDAAAGVERGPQERLRQAFARLTVRREGPYASCAPCRRPCALWEVGEAVAEDPHSRRELAEGLATREPGASTRWTTATLARALAARWCDGPAAGIAGDLALCIGIHLGRAHDLAEDEIVAVAHDLATAQREGGDDGSARA